MEKNELYCYDEVADAEFDPTELETPVSEPKSVIGIVTNCLRLNVRKEPNPDAEVACVIDALTEVMIDESGSTTDFYKVCTASGIEGYCMRKYIAV